MAGETRSIRKSHNFSVCSLCNSFNAQKASENSPEISYENVVTNQIWEEQGGQNSLNESEL